MPIAAQPHVGIGADLKEESKHVLEPDFNAARTTFVARVIGQLRGGESLADAIGISSRIGWIFAVGDSEQSGICWRWPGPEDFAIDDDVADDIVSGWSSAVFEIEEHVGRVFPANHETSGSSDKVAAVVDKKARFRKPKA